MRSPVDFSPLQARRTLTCKCQLFKKTSSKKYISSKNPLAQVRCMKDGEIPQEEEYYLHDKGSRISGSIRKIYYASRSRKANFKFYDAREDRKFQ